MAERGETDVVMVPRKNIILGRWLRYGQWWPNRKPRFFRRDSMDINDRIHAGLAPQPGARRLLLPEREDQALWHFSYDSLEDLLEKTNRYTSVEARQRVGRSRPMSTQRLFRGAARSFWREYVRGGGRQDGHTGLIVAVIRSFYWFLMVGKTWDEPARRSRPHEYELAKARLLGLEPGTGTDEDAAGDAPAARPAPVTG